MTIDDAPKDVATVAGGCFWCLEAIFEMIEGVGSVVSGYTGGHTEEPTYEEICSGATGHAEAVQIQFENSRIDYEAILNIFFAYHDPTALNRQGNDVGTQYRSAVFYHDDFQRNLAGSVIERLDKKGAYSGAIVTEVNPFVKFYDAEDYHQSFYKSNPRHPYCQAIIVPKVRKMIKNHESLLKSDSQ